MESPGRTILPMVGADLPPTRPPKYIRVGATSYRVVEDKFRLDDHDAWGRVSFRDQTITLHPDQHPDSYCETLLHEVIHVAFHDAGYRGIEESSKEQETTRITPRLLQILRDNPELVAFLLKGKPQ